MAEKCNKCGGWITLEETSVTNETEWCMCRKNTWSRTPPTEPGWYWFMTPISEVIVMVFRKNEQLFMLFNGVADSFLLDNFTGEWSARIEPPE